jgi:hypothetical protein
MTGTSGEQIMAERRLESVGRESGRQLREALLEVGTHLGWDHQTVIRISESVTGRAWQRCGGDDVVRVAMVLLEVASALRSANRVHAGSDADAAGSLDVPGVLRQQRV